MDRLIVDTSVLVAVEREDVDLEDVASEEADAAIAAVTVAELLVGAELADARRRRRRRDFVDRVLGLLPVEAYDLDAARAHAGLLVHTRRTGRPRGAHDLIVAATALACGRTVVAADRHGFEGLPGVAVRSPG